MTPVCLCDPQPVVQEGLRSVLAGSQEFTLSGRTDSLAGVDQMLALHKPELLIIDRGFGMHPVLELIARLQHEHAPKIVVWAANISDVECFRALQAGALGIMKKTIAPAELFECLRAVESGKLWTEKVAEIEEAPLSHPRMRPLTPREQQVAELVAKGLKNREIGETLEIATGTVKIHLMHIFEKTGIRDRFELALQGLREATEHAKNGHESPAWDEK